MKKVLILSGSPRKGGNSDLLCDEFMRGALASGNEVTKIRVAEKNVGYCRACYACARNGGVCVQNDDMKEILSAMESADVLVLATPVYFYSASAQLKTVIDRTLARWTKLKNKEFYYIMTSAEESDTVMDGTLAVLRGFADCLEGSAEKGILMGQGAEKRGDIREKPAFAAAFEMGRNIR